MKVSTGSGALFVACGVEVEGKWAAGESGRCWEFIWGEGGRSFSEGYLHIIMTADKERYAHGGEMASRGFWRENGSVCLGLRCKVKGCGELQNLEVERG